MVLKHLPVCIVLAFPVVSAFAQDATVGLTDTAIGGAGTGGRHPMVEPPTLLRGRGWGPEQATGAPDTPTAGDIQTTGASRTPDEREG